MKELPDRRSLAFPDEPYSAYCKVCWQGVYCLWIDKEDHHRGECMYGHKAMTDCSEAVRWERSIARIKHAMKNTAPKPDTPTSKE